MCSQPCQKLMCSQPCQKPMFTQPCQKLMCTQPCKSCVYSRVRNRCLHSSVKNWCVHIHPFIHPWRYSPFRTLASLISRLHSSLLAALLLHPLIPRSCRASLWTTSAHLILGLTTGLAVRKFPFKTLFGILCSSILTICPAHPSLLKLMSSTMFGSLYRL